MRNLVKVRKYHVKQVEIKTLKDFRKKPKSVTMTKIQAVAEQIKSFGCPYPVLISENREVLCGHAIVQAHRLLKMTHVPTVLETKLTEAEKKAYLVAHGFDVVSNEEIENVITEELQTLQNTDFDTVLSDITLQDLIEAETKEFCPVFTDKDDIVPPPKGFQTPLQTGEVFRLGRHMLICESNVSHVVSVVLDKLQPKLCSREPCYQALVKPLCELLLKETQRRDFVIGCPDHVGSLLIACELIDRSAVIIESDLKQSAIIIKRYEAYTGKRATRMSRQYEYNGKAQETRLQD